MSTPQRDDERDAGGIDRSGAPFDRARAEAGAPRDEERIVVRPEISVSRAEARELDRRAGWAAANWGWLAAFGAIGIVFGLIVLSRAFGSLTALVWLTGLFLIFAGVAQLVTVRGGAPWARFASAAIAVIGGLVLLVWPGETLKVVAVIGGITVLLWGVVRAAGALRSASETRAHDLLVGLALGVLGILMIVWPGATITLIGVLVGLAAVAWGVVTIVVALRLRRDGARWRELHARSHIAS